MSSLHVFFLLLLFLSSRTLSQSTIQILPVNRTIRQDDTPYCESWKFSIETNDAGFWNQLPTRCVQFVQDYMIGDRYKSDLQVVSGNSLDFATTVEVAADGKDGWVFDIDETLLSNLPYYETHGFGSAAFDERSFDEWVDLAEAPALPASLSLYKAVEELGFKIFLLTGRSEYQRNATVRNLLCAGFSNWERLFLRRPSDHDKMAVVYKSEKRSELLNEGYRIHGSSGDQWSDLLGFAVARRSFKLPNPMYYVA